MQCNILKHNPFSFFIVNRVLNYQCRNVKGYIFVATTGRSGSNSLAKIFDAVDDGVCFHEPHPIMYDDFSGSSDKGRYFDRLFEIKKVYIKRAARLHRYYIETNHQFIKNFAQRTVAAFGEKIKIIHLVRSPIEVAMSFYRINSIPGKSARGQLYLLDPAADNNILDLRDTLFNNKSFSHDLYKCFWYWYEIEARIVALNNLYSTVPLFRLETLDLNNYAPLERMFHTLDISFSPDKLESLVGSKENAKLDQKSRKLDSDEAADMHNLFLKQLSQKYPSDLWVS